jgi:hypothetical protein
MAYVLDLSGCWAKQKRAVVHIDQLRAEILKAGAGDPKTIPLRREYDSQDRAVVYRIERVIEIADHWPLLVGDAIHNLRSALDHLAWQLALRFFNGSTPPDTVIRHIQFPIVSDRTTWPGHIHRKYMIPDDVKPIEPYEPYHPREPGKLHPLEALVTLSNIDKHRLLHIVNVVPHEAASPTRVTTEIAFRLLRSRQTAAERIGLFTAD